MNGKIMYLLIFCLVLISLPVGAENIFLVDSLSRIESCKRYSQELNLSKQKVVSGKVVNEIKFELLKGKFSNAEEKFFKLDITEADNGFNEVVKIISDAFIIGADIEEIYNLFGRSLLYKILIYISQKKEDEAKRLYRNYFTILSSFPIDKKKFHPLLISFIRGNSSEVQKSIKYNSDISQLLIKTFDIKSRIMFDASRTIPQSVSDTNHLLIIMGEKNICRTIVKNFAEEKDLYFLVQENDNEKIYIFSGEEALKTLTLLELGKELIFCNESEKGLILSDGKRLTADEIAGKNMKVEILKAEDVSSDRWYSKWWVYASAGTVTAAIITSIILLNTQSPSNGDFRDHIQVK